MPKSAKKLTKMENHSSDDEEDALEMERNFALLSKRSAMQTSAEDDEKIRDEDGSAEDDEAPEEDEDGSAEVEDNGMDDEGDTGSEDDESVSDHEDGGSQAQPHWKGSINSGKKISEFYATILSFKILFADPYFTFTLISLCLYRIINHVI